MMLSMLSDQICESLKNMQLKTRNGMGKIIPKLINLCRVIDG